MVARATAAEQLSLIRAHPDLVGRLTLTAESQTEQAAAGLTALAAAEIAEFDQLNQQYRAKFDFPFVICARLNNKTTILPAFQEQLVHQRDQELKTALGEIVKIDQLRLAEKVTED